MIAARISRARGTTRAALLSMTFKVARRSRLARSPGRSDCGSRVVRPCCRRDGPRQACHWQGSGGRHSSRARGSRADRVATRRAWRTPCATRQEAAFDSRVANPAGRRACGEEPSARRCRSSWASADAAHADGRPAPSARPRACDRRRSSGWGIGSTSCGGRRRAGRLRPSCEPGPGGTTRNPRDRARDPACVSRFDWYDGERGTPTSFRW